MRKISFFFIIIFFFSYSSHAFEFKNPFKKKQSEEKIKMVETVEEWENEAQDIPIEEREIKPRELPKTDKKFYYPEIKKNLKLIRLFLFIIT